MSECEDIAIQNVGTYTSGFGTIKKTSISPRMSTRGVRNVRNMRNKRNSAHGTLSQTKDTARNSFLFRCAQQPFGCSEVCATTKCGAFVVAYTSEQPKKCEMFSNDSAKTRHTRRPQYCCALGTRDFKNAGGHYLEIWHLKI